MEPNLTCECCDETIGKNSTTGRCGKCQSAYRYWNSRRPAQRLLRRGKLELWHFRLDAWFKEDGKGKS